MKLMDGNDLYDSCSITLSSDGLIIRNVIPSHACRSSAYQFCCNQDLCNFLPSPPLPAFTTLTCAINDCRMNNNQCNNSNDSVIYRSSATESCIRIHRDIVYKSYQIGCSPKTTAITSLTGELISENLFCCNYPKCNQRIFPPGEAIRCYTCDSRITGLKDCMILNTSSSHVYNSASSNPSESCAMIVGQTGKDLMTGRNYPAFTIRTFINNCINQSLGNVTYGGATFQGRIDCCSTSLCNIHPLYINLTSSTIKSKRVFSTSKVIVSTLIICLGFIFIIIGISLSIYRFHLNKSYHCYTPGIFSDGSTTLFLSSRLN
ncbi:unnamed protein product [Rotaria sp. Silwood1]|nr:unnamed protein product [Rotaria sp. Silwood1]CAF1180683.1 unnamed protein product [Rotaria sp. Silwood1]